MQHKETFKKNDPCVIPYFSTAGHTQTRLRKESESSSLTHQATDESQGAAGEPQGGELGTLGQVPVHGEACVDVLRYVDEHCSLALAVNGRLGEERKGMGGIGHAFQTLLKH